MSSLDVRSAGSSATIAATKDNPINSRWELCVSTWGMSRMLNSSEPTIAPTVFAA